MTVTLIILIHNINSFYNSLDQSDQNLRLRIFCIFHKGEQPFFCQFQVTDSNHIVLSAFVKFGKLPLRFSQFFSQILQILLNKLLDTAVSFTQISCLGCNIRFQPVTFLFNKVMFLYLNLLLTWNKAFMPCDHNDPLADRLAFNGLNIFLSYLQTHCRHGQ